MVDSCIFTVSGIPGLDQTPGSLPPPVISSSTHEKILPRSWQCQACSGITTCDAYQLHLNPLVSTTNPVISLDNLDQPSLQPGISSSFLESSSSDSDDIPNDRSWKSSRRMTARKPRTYKRPKERRVQYHHRIEPSACHFCKRPITLASTLLNKSLGPICTLSGENLISDRFIPAGIRCCKCDRPHYLSSRLYSRQPGQDHPSKKSHITYQPSSAPDPRNPWPPCTHCLPNTPNIHEKTVQEACGGDCWVISAYGERLAKIKDLFTPVSLPWLLTAVITSDQRQVQQKQGLLHRHERLCEEYITRCSLDLNREISRKARLHTAFQERAVMSVGRDHLRRSALGEGGMPRVVNKEMVTAERRVVNARKKVSEAERWRREVLEKIGEARMWVLGLFNGGRGMCGHELAGDKSDVDGGAEGDVEMDDFHGVDRNGNGNGIETGPVKDYDGDTTMDVAGEEQHHQQAVDNIPRRRDIQRSLRVSLAEKDRNVENGSQHQPGNRNKERNCHDEPEPEADPSYERYCGIKGIAMYEPKPRRR